ncbi:UV DNA damage repair endonuclease UvsE [Halonatronum saccharophilum]|uniref:UV DNA damage repair endonuclease UvsE n=1 Tax=Halonatronum saccharophilum TaxID=150060 RepID=UPI000480BADC|nr:UV DNA damage repair endonuclease UvsE [Halonatronum saccharophilum]
MELGYACVNMSLKDASPNHRITLNSLKKLSSEGQRIRLKTIAKKNLANTLRILKFNKAHNINFYRFSSNIVPLATHPIMEGWDYILDLKKDLLEVGNYVKKNGMRTSTHPGQYTVLNSNREDIVSRAIDDLEYHSKLLIGMGLDRTHKMVLHIGGAYGNKEKAIEKFKSNFARLSEDIKGRLIIENDDTTYNTTEVLEIAEDLGIPMVFDIHHFNCNHQEDEDLKELIPRIFATWGDEKPKLHFSSPKSEKKYASHADNIEKDDFLEYIDLLKSLTDKDFDIMLECKNKDKALLKLREEIKVES